MGLKARAEGGPQGSERAGVGQGHRAVAHVQVAKARQIGGGLRDLLRRRQGEGADLGRAVAHRDLARAIVPIDAMHQRVAGAMHATHGSGAQHDPFRRDAVAHAERGGLAGVGLAVNMLHAPLHAWGDDQIGRGLQGIAGARAQVIDLHAAGALHGVEAHHGGARGHAGAGLQSGVIARASASAAVQPVGRLLEGHAVDAARHSAAGGRELRSAGGTHARQCERQGEGDFLEHGNAFHERPDDAPGLS